MSTDKPLVTIINEHLAGDLSELPVFHTVAVRLQQALARHDYTIDEILEMISEDQSIVGKILKVANSSYYAGLSKVATLKEAIVRLGAQEIANVAMMASQFDRYQSQNEKLNACMQALWGHALSCAVGAKWLARKAGYTAIAPEAFMGGLLHDIGKLALLKVLDDIIKNGESRVALTDPLIDEILTNMHEEVGYNLMRSWSLPETYAAISVNHHRPEFDGNNILLVVVRLANEACRKAGKDIKVYNEIALIACPEAQTLGLREITLAELEIVVEDAGGLSDEED